MGTKRLGWRFLMGGLALVLTFIDLAALKFIVWMGWTLQEAVIYVVLFNFNLVFLRLDDLRDKSGN